MSNVFARLFLLVMAALLAASAPAVAPIMPLHGTRQSTEPPVGRIMSLGPLAPGQTLALSLVLRSRAPGELATSSHPHQHTRVSPVSPLSCGQGDSQRFGVSSEDKVRIEAALRAAGLPMPRYSEDGLLAGLRVTVGQAQSFFGVRLSRYRAEHGRVYYAPDRPPQLPAALGGAAVGVLGLDQRVTLAGHAEFAPQSASVSGVTGLSPSDIDRAYDFGPLDQFGLDGYSQTIALA